MTVWFCFVCYPSLTPCSVFHSLWLYVELCTWFWYCLKGSTVLKNSLTLIVFFFHKVATTAQWFDEHKHLILTRKKVLEIFFDKAANSKGQNLLSCTRKLLLWHVTQVLLLQISQTWKCQNGTNSALMDMKMKEKPLNVSKRLTG